MSSSSSAAPPTTTTTTAASKSVAWLLTLQQRFLEGQDCDVIVRVSIEQPAAKRPRADDVIGAGDGEATARAQDRTVDIPCYSPILKSRSRYFKAAFSSAYVENQQKIVEIVLADAQAVEDLRLFIKLSCGVSYVEDSGMRLPNSTRLRLAFLGNAFEFVDCVQECLQSLSEEDMTLADALSLLDEMPEELW